MELFPDRESAIEAAESLKLGVWELLNLAHGPGLEVDQRNPRERSGPLFGNVPIAHGNAREGGHSSRLLPGPLRPQSSASAQG